MNALFADLKKLIGQSGTFELPTFNIKYHVHVRAVRQSFGNVRLGVRMDAKNGPISDWIRPEFFNADKKDGDK